MRYLEESVAARVSKLDDPKKSYRPTEVSQPSPVVNIPYPGKLYAGPVNWNDRGSSESRVKVVFTTLDANTGMELITDREAYRGGVGSLQTKAKGINFANNTLQSVDEAKISLDTVILDFAGGDSVMQPGAPTQLLLMGSDGKLHVRSIVSDARRFDVYQKLLNPPQRNDTPPSDNQGRGRGRNPP